MIKKIVALATGVILFLIGCQRNPNSDKVENDNSQKVGMQYKTQMTDIPFVLVKNYFVKNTLEKLDNPKIETAEMFNEIFGMATVMGKDGQPTEIDFKEQYVIAVILPDTDLETTMAPVSLQKDEKGKLTLTYKTLVGQKQSYIIRPFFAIAVDKTENGIIELKEQQ